MTGLRTRSVLATATVLIAGSAVTGCSAGEAELKASAAKQLQSGVLSVTTAAAEGDFATAASALANVQADVLTAAAAGDVTADRSREIQAAIKLVAVDLETAMTAGTPTETPEPPADEPEPTEEPTLEPTQEPEPMDEPAEEPTEVPTDVPPTEPTEPTPVLPGPDPGTNTGSTGDPAP